MSLDEPVVKGGSYMIELEHARQLLTMAGKELYDHVQKLPELSRSEKTER